MAAGTRKATIVVKDTEVGELPKAGSTGIFPYIGVATALMCGAMVMTVVTGPHGWLRRKPCASWW